MVASISHESVKLWNVLKKASPACTITTTTASTTRSDDVCESQDRRIGLVLNGTTETPPLPLGNSRHATRDRRCEKRLLWVDTHTASNLASKLASKLDSYRAEFFRKDASCHDHPSDARTASESKN